MRGFSLKPAKSVVVLMHLSTHIANFLLHQAISMLLVLEHHFHKIEFALHEAPSAQRAVNISHIERTILPSAFLYRLKGRLQVHKFG